MTVKGVKFGNLREIGNPVELGLAYQQQGADELTFLDISASHEQRAIVFDLVKDVANNLSIPFTVGGGISSLDTVKRLLQCGADKISVNTSAVERPALVREIADSCGSQCCVVAIDVRRRKPGSEPLTRRILDDASVNGHGNWEVLVKGGRVSTGRNALDWAMECVENGAGEILLTSWDKDGTLEGFDTEMVRAFAQRLPIPVIASGGARDPDSFVEVFTTGMADAALAASIFHDGTWTIASVKEQLDKAGVPVRLC